MAQETDRPKSNDGLPAIAGAAREHAVSVLRQHYVQDAITESEFEARLERVFAATTQADLDAALAGLPAIATRGAAAPREVGERIAAVLSGQERRITSTVPRAIDIKSLMGYVELDLTGAEFEPGVTTIDVRALMGYVKILLPSDVRVESDGRAVLGFFALKGGHPSSSANVVRITGRAMLGFVECYVGTRRRVPPHRVSRPQLEAPSDL